MALSTTAETSLIENFDEVTEVVAQWGAKYVDEMVRVFSPDGRALGMEKLSEAEEIERYMRELRGNSEAWANWIREKVSLIKGELTKSGLSEEIILSVHPYDVAERFAIVYSSRMENLVREYNRNALGGPTVLDILRGESEGEPASDTRVKPRPSLPMEELTRSVSPATGETLNNGPLG
jgi:hypothetical protein